MNIRICCPSYKRPVVKTLKYLPFCRVFVAPEEFEEYKTANPAADIIACPAGVQGNLCRVRNYILRSEFASGADVVAILDDDYSGVFYFESGKQVFPVKTDDFMPFIEKYSTLAREWGARFWGINVNPDPQCYRENVPFSTLSYIGGPFQIFLNGNECFYDERLPLKEDYDMTLQQINRYRIALRINKFFYRVQQAEQSGGCAVYRNLEKERQQLELLRKKWGSQIIRIDTQDRSHRGKKKHGVAFDFNPVIRVPIRGL